MSSECDDSDEGARLSEQAFVGTPGYIRAVFCLPTRALLHARKYSKIECCSFGVEIATIESRVMMSWDRELGRLMLNLARRKGSTHLCGTSRTLGGDHRVARRVYQSVRVGTKSTAPVARIRWLVPRTYALVQNVQLSTCGLVASN